MTDGTIAEAKKPLEDKLGEYALQIAKMIVAGEYDTPEFFEKCAGLGALKLVYDHLYKADTLPFTAHIDSSNLML